MTRLRLGWCEQYATAQAGGLGCFDVAVEDERDELGDEIQHQRDEMGDEIGTKSSTKETKWGDEMGTKWGRKGRNRGRKGLIPIPAVGDLLC